MKVDRAIFLFVIAPVGAAVVIAALLLFGASPHRVFLFGFAVRSMMAAMGIHAPNAVGVLSTVFLYWVIIVVIGLLWDRRKRRG